VEPKHVICAAIEHTIPERGVKAWVGRWSTYFIVSRWSQLEWFWGKNGGKTEFYWVDAVKTK